MSSSLKEILARQAAGNKLRPGGDPVPSRSADAPAGNGTEDRKPRSKSSALLIPPLPEVCRNIVDAIPYSVRGDDRTRYLVEQVNNLPDKARTSLRLHVEHFLLRMLDTDASDIDFGGHASNRRIWYRVNGKKKPDEGMGAYAVEETTVLILNLLTETQVRGLVDDRSIDISYNLPVSGERDRRFRCTIYFDYEQIALNMRSISEEVRDIRSLGFHPAIERGLMFRHERDGLTLITGVTGSGKSTTLDSLVDANNKDFSGHIVIIAKPIEYLHESKRCIIRHREVGADVHSFKEGIVQSLRQDPDIVVIGEIRDPITISSAIEITDSGHKVFSTLHTSSAVESIARIIGEYPPYEQERIRNRLADVLRCVVSQKLLPKVGGGRVLAKEVLWVTSSVKAAIKNDNVGEIYQMIWEGAAEGQVTLEQDLARLVRENKITVEAAIDFANVKRRLQQLLR